MIYMLVESVIGIHHEEIKISNGLHGIRDYGLLISAVESARQTFYGELLYDTPQKVASVYLLHLVKNHPFIDGNKRTGIGVYVSFMICNGYQLMADQNKLYDLTIGVADGTLAYDDVVKITDKIFTKKN